MPHFALMFHHFHNEKHPNGQGAISSGQFEALLDKYEDRLLSAEDWATSFLSGTLKDGQVCITLDDGLLCQYEIALPVLKARNIKAFWFPYTGVHEDISDSLEIYRLFRTIAFADIDEFYEAFDQYLEVSPWKKEIHEKTKAFDPKTYLEKHSFYTDGDRRFRYIRDRILGPDNYSQAMDGLMAHVGFDKQTAQQNLWMNRDNLAHLHKEGHIIGLHSHTHPTCMINLPAETQHWEYDTNFQWLQSNLGITPYCISYPCGSYNESTLAYLKTRNITIGFRASMENTTGNLEISRLDHVLA